MATQARGAATKAKNQIMAQRMKDMGIRRTHGICPICYKAIRIPMDFHFVGGH